MLEHPDGIAAPRFTGIPTFMRAPYAAEIKDIDIAMAGVPYDGGVTNRPGARHGPREIRNQSSFMRGIHHVSNINPFEICRVADVGDGPTYISFDVDGLDPVYAPGTGTPEVGGITTVEAQKLLRGLGGLNLVGGDVVEVAPPFDPSGNTALVGATMMFEILCLLAGTVRARG